MAQDPEVAEAFVAGADPTDLYLASGQSLAEYFEAAASTLGLVYRTLSPCRVLATHFSDDGKMAANESRPFLVRGAMDLTSQGGSSTGCGVPTTAAAVMSSFMVFAQDGAGSLWARAAGMGRYELLVNWGAGGGRNNSTILRLCSGTCTADFDLRTVAGGAHVVARVVGYFSTLAETELPSHTHDGAQIASGEVDEDVIDPDIARDVEVLAHSAAASAHHVPTVDTTCDGEACDGESFTNVRAATGDSATGFFAEGQIEEPRIADEIARDAEVAIMIRGELACPGSAASTDRYTDCGNGTIHDNNMGLIWLKDADCFRSAQWPDAMAEAAALNTGECGLTDGSVEGDWRLPTIGEFCRREDPTPVEGICPASAASHSLLNTNYSSPALSNTTGDGQGSPGDPFDWSFYRFYWSSTKLDFGHMWMAGIRNGAIAVEVCCGSDGMGEIWPVRDP